MRRFGRTSLRLSLQFAFLYSILSAFIFVGAYWLTNYEVRDWLQDQMVSDVTTLQSIYAAGGIDDLAASVDVMAGVNFENARIFQLLGPDGTILAGNLRKLDRPATDGFLLTADIEIDGDFNDEVSGYWITQGRVGPYTLIQGTGDHVVAEVLEALAVTLVTGFLLIMALGSLVGMWVGRLTERRIQSISAAMEKVAAGELAARVPIDTASKDDLSRVSNSINATLEQLENLVESQVQISNDIAHDLRTPLQRLRQRLERMSDQDRADPDDARAALEQVEDVIGTFNALLRIAQIEAGDRRERFQQIDLVDLVTNVHEVFEPSADAGGQTLNVKVPDQPVVVSGDPDLLTQLISDLVENALRHTPAGTTIDIEVARRDGHPTLSVSDDGPGIGPAHRDKVFRRFYRGEQSRTTGGNGLGLSLCKAISELHHATIKLMDNEPGVRIEARFPQTIRR